MIGSGLPMGARATGRRRWGVGRTCSGVRAATESLSATARAVLARARGESFQLMRAGREEEAAGVCGMLPMPPRSSTYSSMVLRRARFAVRSVFRMGVKVNGETALPESSHASIAARSYVFPSLSITGSVIMFLDTGHMNVNGTISRNS